MDKRTYSNGEIEVLWDQSKCIHSANCVDGLPAVFDPKKRPWIAIDRARSDAITAAIDRCPSGALSYRVLPSDGGTSEDATEKPHP
jgi:uncharacterized Fe-S cluster protein YjdI